MDIKDFNGNVVERSVDSKKLSFGKNIRTLTISDLHGYACNSKKAERLAKVIKDKKPSVIFIAGDIFKRGSSWEGGFRLKQFREFIQNLSEAAPVCITWGSQDVSGMIEETRDERLKNFHKLETARPGRVFPLYNDKVFVNGMEIIGFVPKFELMDGISLRAQINGDAHDKFIEDYNNNGIKFENEPGVINVYLGHNPHLIASSEDGVGLGDLSVCDFFVTGHLHDGYKAVLEFLDSMKKKFSLRHKGFKTLNLENSFNLDQGWIYQPSSIANDYKKISRNNIPFFDGPINLCRGIVYIDDNAQQRFLQTADGSFFENDAMEENEQEWKKVTKVKARETILNDNLHFMLISEGIAPAFIKKEAYATIDIVDIKRPKVK